MLGKFNNMYSKTLAIQINCDTHDYGHKKKKQRKTKIEFPWYRNLCVIYNTEKETTLKTIRLDCVL